MQQEEEKTIKRPSVFWLLTEGGRAAAELGLSIPYRKLFKCTEKGDGHPILVLPGFMASDMSTSPIRKYLSKIGYTPYTWDLGRNTAQLKFLDLLIARVEELYEEHGEPVSLIGWSLGGIFARQIAKEKPELIRQIITLGSPFKGVHQPNNVAWLYNFMNPRTPIKDLDPALFADIPRPAPVPSTSIYTKEDGIVPWELCLEDEDSIHQNIQVRGSHLGLGVNPSVWEIIGDRLMYSKHNWAHFTTKSFVKDLLYYPSL